VPIHWGNRKGFDMKRGIGWLPVSAAAVMTLSLGIPQASAQTSHEAGFAAAAPNGTSPGQAGYFLTGPPASASASVKFKVPKVSCGATRSGVAFGAVIFTTSGTTTGSELYLLCKGGSAAYQAVIVVNGTTPAMVGDFTPAAGDEIATSVTESATSARAVFKDLTQGRTVSESATSGGQNAFLLEGADSLLNSDTGTQLPVAKFGTESFTTGKQDRVPVKVAGGTAVNMQTSGGVLQIETGALNAGGGAWREVFKHS
jgi:hypothetical protein